MNQHGENWGEWSQFILKSIETFNTEIKSLWEAVRDLGEDSAASAEITKSISHRVDSIDQKMEAFLKSALESKEQAQADTKRIAAIAAGASTIIVAVAEGLRLLLGGH